ncbi:MAG: hypothetical protein ACK4PR_05340 [Gammaproteobacteria bacterium]
MQQEKKQSPEGAILKKMCVEIIKNEECSVPVQQTSTPPRRIVDESPSTSTQQVSKPARANAERRTSAELTELEQSNQLRFTLLGQSAAKPVTEGKQEVLDQTVETQQKGPN